MFAPLDWLDTVDRLRASGTEADIRTALGRTYYAVWLRSRLSLEEAGLLTPRGDVSDHRRVINALKNNRRPLAGNALGKLLMLRERADYVPDEDVTEQDLDDALEEVEVVRNDCSGDWAKDPFD